MNTPEQNFRIHGLPPYLLGSIAQAVIEARKEGRDIVDLSQLNPDLGVPGVAIEKLVQASLLPHNHRYSASRGIGQLREAICHWYQLQFQVTLNPETQTVVTMGTKEGLAHLLMALTFPGDNIIVPTPSYPVHVSAVFLAHGGFIGLPLYWEENKMSPETFQLSEKSEGFFERLHLVYQHTWPRPKFFILSFPHNPTTTVVTLGFFERLVEFARNNSVYLIHDFAYAHVCFDGYQAPSILQARNAQDVAVEFFSFSKSFAMPGWRVGFCVGNEELVQALVKIKGYIDFGLFQPLQIAAIPVLMAKEKISQEVTEIFQSRRDVLVDGLQSLGWAVVKPMATAFVWAKLPEHLRHAGSIPLSHRFLKEANVAVCPGGGFDASSDHFMRFALGENESRLRSALRNMEEMCSSTNR